MRKKYLALPNYLLVIIGSMALFSCQPSTEHLSKMVEEGCMCYQEVINAKAYSESTVKFKQCDEEKGPNVFNLALNKFLTEHSGFDRSILAPVRGELLACQKGASDYIEKSNEVRSQEHVAWESDTAYVRDGASIVGKWTIDYIGASEIAEWAAESGFTYYEDGRFEQRLKDKSRTGTYTFSENGKKLIMNTDTGKRKVLTVYEISEKYFTYAETGMNSGKVRMRRE